MTSMTILISEKCFKNLVSCIKRLSKKGLIISYEAGKADNDGYRYVTVTSITINGIFLLGIEMGKTFNK